MSARTDRSGGAMLWLVQWPGCDTGELFAGTLDAVVAHINSRHRATGRPHKAREVRS